MAMKIVMFSDYICPFCYVGFETMRKLKSEFDFQLEWRGFQIHPDWPAEGIDSDKAGLPGDPASRQALWQRISAMADAVGFSMKPPALLTNSRAALAATEFARESGRDEALRNESTARTLTKARISATRPSSCGWRVRPDSRRTRWQTQ